jgi:Kelch motif protein
VLIRLIVGAVIVGAVGVAGILATIHWSFSEDTAPWLPAAAAPLPRFAGVTAIVHGRLYTFAGYSDAQDVPTTTVHSYDPVADVWKRHRDLPFDGLTHVNAAVDGTRIWIAGGFTGRGSSSVPTSAVRAYDAESDSWSTGPALPHAVGGGALTLVRRELHYVGGFVEALQNGAEASHWVLDLATGRTWEPRAPLPVARGHAGTVAIDGKIYVVGGSTSHDPPRDSDYVHRYDPETDVWEELASLPSPRSHVEPGTFSWSGRLFVVGGQDYMSARLSEPQMLDISAYDPMSDTWRNLPGLPVRLRAPVAVVLGDKLLVTTGSTLFAERPSAQSWITPCTQDSRSICAPLPGAFGVAHMRGVVRSGLKRIATSTPIRIQLWLHVDAIAGIGD